MQGNIFCTWPIKFEFLFCTLNCIYHIRVFRGRKVSQFLVLSTIGFRRCKTKINLQWAATANVLP